MRQHLLVLLAVLAVAAAIIAPSSSALSAPQTFSLLDVSNQNVAPIGGFAFNRAPVGGDQFAISDSLFKWAGATRGARVGHVLGLGTFVGGFGSNFEQRATVLFTVQAYLPAGSLFINGYGEINPKGPSKFTLPITGGTGAYANARGFVKVRDLGNGEGDKSDVDVHLMP